MNDVNNNKNKHMNYQKTWGMDDFYLDNSSHLDSESVIE